ncbi:MAG: ECF-type sigma factor [Planctomycetales bacterium]
MKNSRTDSPITVWIERLKAGDQSAAGPLWEHYFQPLVRFAANRLRGTPRRAADEEDVALSVFQSFCAAAPAGRFTKLTDRHGLWQLLLRMTRRKAVDYRRRELRKRRGAGAVRGDSAFDDARAPAGLDGFPGPDDIPQFFVELEERLEELRDDTLRAIVVLRLQGHSTGEIAAELDVSRRTVERKLNVVREQWQPPTGEEA